MARAAPARVPSTSPQSATAASMVASTRAPASTSAAPDARACASGSGYDCGRTSTSDASPMFFIARALAPMLPGWLVSTSTIRMEADIAVPG
jgi:hypothetical protein